MPRVKKSKRRLQTNLGSDRDRRLNKLAGQSSCGTDDASRLTRLETCVALLDQEVVYGRT